MHSLFKLSATSVRFQIIPRTPVWISFYLSLHGKSPLFLFPPTHQVSLYANEGRTTSCPSLLATDRLLSPNRSIICFLHKWVVDLQGSMKSEDNMTAVIVVFCQWESYESYLIVCCGLPSKHPPYAPTRPLPRPTDPHINFFSLHWKFENTFSTELKWMTCCHVRLCSAVLNYPHMTPRHTTLTVEEDNVIFLTRQLQGRLCFFWWISNQICDVNIWTFFTSVETFLLQTLKQVQCNPTGGKCFNNQHHSGEFSREQPKCMTIPQKMYHPRSEVHTGVPMLPFPSNKTQVKQKRYGPTCSSCFQWCWSVFTPLRPVSVRMLFHTVSGAVKGCDCHTLCLCVIFFSSSFKQTHTPLSSRVAVIPWVLLHTIKQKDTLMVHCSLTKPFIHSFVYLALVRIWYMLLEWHFSNILAYAHT